MLVTLSSSDGQSFEGNFISSEPFPIPNVDGRILKLVIDWLTQHKDDVVEAPDVTIGERFQIGVAAYPQWDQDFIGPADNDTVFSLLLAANYLDIKGLTDLCCTKLQHQVKGKTPAEIRQTFHIKNDLTPEEQIREDKLWMGE